LFDAVTKYGLALAQLLPTLEATERYRLEAELSWGKQKERLKLLREGGRGGAAVEPSELPDEVRTLLERLLAQKAPYRIEIAEELLDVEGGVLVPDLRFVSEETGAIVYLEVLGHWSRAAVWRRIELVSQPDFSARVLFAVSERLRVSEEVLPPEAPAELYVYKGVMSAKTVLERIARLSAADRVTG
jgi:predicted nuclease of restriction endonuclease-like RecB superfamily